MTTTKRLSRFLGITTLVLLAASAVAEQAGGIPGTEVKALDAELSAARGQGSSYVAQRRALKNVVRSGQALIDGNPKASNRFAVLEIVFQAQKRILALENNERNMSALFETCEAMIKAPDEYAKTRLEADLMLSERRLSAGNATLVERAEDLARLIERYRGTVVEAKSLMMASLIAQKLDSRELESSIKQAMDERFRGGHEMIEFRREHLNAQRVEASFQGSFERLDGTCLNFPSDIMGLMSFIVFWSKDASSSEGLLKKIKEYEDQYAGRIDVYSFNVDELADGGQSILKEYGLDWTVMKLPEGRKSSVYRAYAREDAVALFVNAYGLTILKPEAHFDATGWRSEQTAVYAISDERISGERYLAQLQSVMVGECLAGEGGGERVEERPTPNVQRPTSTVRVGENGFVRAPFRYRLTREEALENYRRVEKVNGEVVDEEGDSSGLWDEHNRRIIALLGMWKLECEPKHLDKAVREAKAALEQIPTPPVGHPSKEGGLYARISVVPRYCLAKAAIREKREDALSIIETFFNDCGGSNAAPASAVAAASILSLDTLSVELHEKYRGIFLEKHADDPAFYAFSAFLRDKLHRFRLLQPNHTKRERYVRGTIVSFGGTPSTNRLPAIELNLLDGKTLALPDEGAEKMTILAFLEPPEKANENFSVVVDSRGRTNHNEGVHGMMAYAQLFVDKHINQGIEVTAAFLCDDPQRVEWLMKENDWKFQAALVPGGLNNPMVNQLGILSADGFPNIFLLRRDGTVAWSGTGLKYREFGHAWVHHLGMKVHIEQSELEHGYKYLAKGDYKEAARIFAGPFLPWAPDRYGWRPARYHGRALALMVAKDNAPALVAIDKAIHAHNSRHYRGPQIRDAEEREKAVAAFEMQQPCNVMLELREIKAMILDASGRAAEAKTLRARYKGMEPIVHEDIYQQFHWKLREFRLNSL